MRALQSFHHESPANFGAWFMVMLANRPLPWSWDQEDAALLLRWFHHFDWSRHLGQYSPSNSGAASALAVLLAQAYQSCFAGDGDTAVWKRLGQVTGLPDTAFGANVTNLTRQLGLYKDCTAESDLIHVIPFLKLVGCPQQALPSLGQQLRSSSPVGKRFRALATAQWGPDAEALLKAWMREGRGVPPFLSPAEAELLQREPEAKKEEQGFIWRVLQMTTGAFMPVLFSTSTIPAGDWRGATGQTVTAEVARTHGIPQVTGRDGLVQGGGQTLEVSWPNTPTFWCETKPTPRGVRHVYQKGKGGGATLVCLPPKWSLDGDGDPSWRWVPIKGRCTLFDPSGNPWQPRDESPTWDALDGIAIEGQPNITILHELPSGLQKLETRGGQLGSTLREGAVWRNDDLGVPPLGHLILSWVSKQGIRRTKEIYCLPTLQLAKSLGERPTVWIRGMEGLVGREEGGRYYELEIEAKANAWTSVITFRGWGPEPVLLRLEGPLNPYGVSLYGWRPHHPWSSHGPWHVGPGFPMQAYEANLRIEVALPPTAESRVWVDNLVPLWPDKMIKHQRRLGPLEFHEPLKPLWDVIEPMARPVRLSLAWANLANPEDERLRSALLARIFPREAPLSVRVMGEWGLQVRVKGGTGGGPDLKRLVIKVGSTKNPLAVHEFPLDSLTAAPIDNGIVVQVPPQDPAHGPYHLGLRSEEEDLHPISIHVDGRGKLIPRAVEAHFKAVRGRMIGGVCLREDLPDYRDQQLRFVYDLAETHNLLELLERGEIQHWLEYLGDDFLFSQPWTLGIALRHPKMTLEHIIGSTWSDEKKLQALGNLGQSGWTWWIIPPADIASMDPEVRTPLLAFIAQLARRRVTALDGITNPGIRSVAIARLCEEGLFLHLEPAAQRLLLEWMGFPVEMMEQPSRAQDLAPRLCQQQGDFLGGLIQGIFTPSPEPPPPLPKPPVSGLAGLPPVLEPLTRLSGWGRAYHHWMQTESSSLICAKSWADATPEVFRHYGPLFTFFALLNWKD